MAKKNMTPPAINKVFQKNTGSGPTREQMEKGRPIITARQNLKQEQERAKELKAEIDTLLDPNNGDITISDDGKSFTLGDYTATRIENGIEKKQADANSTLIKRRALSVLRFSEKSAPPQEQRAQATWRITHKGHPDRALDGVFSSTVTGELGGPAFEIAKLIAEEADPKKILNLEENTRTREIT